MSLATKMRQLTRQADNQKADEALRYLADVLKSLEGGIEEAARDGRSGYRWRKPNQYIESRVKVWLSDNGFRYRDSDDDYSLMVMW